MNLLHYQMTKRKEYLETLKNQLEQEMKNFPEGNLRVCNDRGIPRYFHVSKPSDTRGEYISKENKELPKQLAQKDYAQKLYKKVNIELADVNKFLNRHSPDELEQVYPTKKDELVRSKSEVMLADMYYEMGIPYRYEAELVVKSGKKKYPDFTLLKTSTREIIYHEHLGLLDDEEYRAANLVKLEEYRKNGIYLGKNLILTYEAEGHFLNIKDIKKIAERTFQVT